jgi:hypothetical protein
MILANKTVIYILGAGRSGTTLLDIVLGNQDGIFSCGELNRFASCDGVSPLQREGVKKKFWRDVKQRLVAKFAKNNLSLESSLCKKYEYHTSFLFSLIFKKNKDFEKYNDYNRRLYSAIFESIKEEIIIDSSKYPGRLYYLYKTGVNVKVIYLKRSLNSVVNSFQKKNIEQPSKSIFFSIIYYYTVNFLCKFALLLLSSKLKFVNVDFENFIADKAKTIDKISTAIDVDLKDLILLDEFKVGNLFDGNRIRLKKKIIIK